MHPTWHIQLAADRAGRFYPGSRSGALTLGEQGLSDVRGEEQQLEDLGNEPELACQAMWQCRSQAPGLSGLKAIAR
jgi:hypothetical protein